MQPRATIGVWATPLAFAGLAVVALRTGRAEPELAVVAALLALVGLGLARAVAGSRGGLAGRVGELVLAGAGLAWLLAEPASHRTVVALAGCLAAGGLALAGVWEGAGPLGRRRLVAVAGAGLGLALAPGMAGAAHWPLKALLVAASLAVTGRALAAVTPPLYALAALVALAASVGPGHTLPWLLPPLAALGLWALQERLPWLLVVAAVGAAAAPPAGLVLALGLLAAACRSLRSPLPLAGLLPAAALAWWRLPAGLELLAAPGLEGVVAALPLAPATLPLLLPLAVLGLAGRVRPAAEARDALAVALLALPLLGRGSSLVAAAASLWLLALPALGVDERLQRAASATLPWTFGASLALLLLAPWGGAACVPCEPWALTAGWAVALALSLVPHRLARLAWLAPVAGLLFTVPVEGADRQLAAGETLVLAAAPSGTWALEVEPADGAGSPLPVGLLGDARGMLAAPAGSGREAVVRTRTVGVQPGSTPATLEVAADVVVRAEDAAAWRARRVRLLVLLGGALLALAAAHVVPGAAPLPLAVASVAGLAAAVAAGSSVATLARAAAVGAADLAAVVALGAWLAVRPVLGQRRLAAAALLLVPLALAQPLLRVPAGDEVYHLELLESLTADHDVALANNLDRDDPNQVAYAVYGNSLIHSPVLALLALPGYLLLGHPGALLLTALALAGALALAARRAEQLGAGRRAVEVAWLAALASYPTLTFATQLWPEALGALLVAALLAAAAHGSAVGAALATGAALLVKLRLGLFALPVALVTAVRRRVSGLVTLGAASAVALAGTALLFGSPLARHRLADLLPASAWPPLKAAWGLAFDGAGGLLFAAPLWLVAAVFLPALWRRGGAGERALVVGVAATVGVLALRRFGEWFGGGSPPARYLVPALPLALLAVAVALGDARGRRLVRFALPWTAVVAWVAATRPLWLFNPVDGGWWLPDRLATALGVAARDVLPTVLRPSLAVVAVPAVLVGVSCWWVRRSRPAAAAALLLGLVVLTSVAVGRREARVHVEDPQVWHGAGAADPPSGTVNRAATGIAWRLPPGGELVVPWRPPLGRDLTARVRAVGPSGAGGRLVASWDGAPEEAREVVAAAWRQVALPLPLGVRPWAPHPRVAAGGGPATRRPPGRPGGGRAVKGTLVVVPSLGGPTLARCMEALADLEPQPEQVVVVLSGAASRAEVPGGPEVVRVARRLGFAAAVNRGLGHLRPALETVALLNDDALPERGWLGTLEAALAADPSVAAVQGSVLDGGGLTVDGRGIALDRFGLPVQVDRGVPAAPEPAGPRPVLAVSCTAALLRTAALDQTRLASGAVLDPAFGSYHEDLDLGLRLDRLGWRSTWVANAGCRHLGSATGRSLAWRHPWWVLANRWRALAANLRPAVLLAGLPRLGRGELRAVHTLTRANPRAPVVALAVGLALPGLLGRGFLRRTPGPRLTDVPWSLDANPGAD